MGGQSGNRAKSKFCEKSSVKMCEVSMIPFREQYEQLPRDNRVLIIDDYDQATLRTGTYVEVVNYFRSVFSQVVVIVSEDYLQGEHHDQATNPSPFGDFMRLAICEFGHLRLESLANKWLTLSSTFQRETSSSLMDDVARTCKFIQQTLRSNAIPHHPWVLLVLLRQAGNRDQSGPKNGSYGHLYNAIITAALSRSKIGSIDIQSKYTYLANLAHTLYQQRTATLSDEEMRRFNADHWAHFDVHLDYEPLRDDLVNTGILRMTVDMSPFAKYSYCFFLAWHLSRNIHKSAIQSTISELIARLYHEESANTVVFLAHLSTNPLILEEMRRCAASMFAGVTPANLDSDVAFLEARKNSKHRNEAACERSG